MVTYVEIDRDGWRFQPRVAAVCVWQNHVLLQGALDGAFWVLPGAACSRWELTADALIRTMRWEIAQKVTVQRLLWVMEYVTRIAGRAVHELGFYYAIDLPANSPFLDVTRDHAGVERGQTCSCAGSRSATCRTLRSSQSSFARRWRTCRTARSTSSRWTSRNSRPACGNVTPAIRPARRRGRPARQDSA